MTDIPAEAAETLAETLQAAADTGLPGIVAGLTGRDALLWTGASGPSSLGSSSAMQADAVLAVFSCTKIVTATAVLQLVEEGLLDLDAPAGLHIPEIDSLKVIEGFAPDGTPLTRPARRRITTRMLLLHTAGFGYDFFNETYARLTRDKRHPPVASCRRASLTTPLLFDPGERWEYGSSMDWAGLVVEAVRGARLGDVFAERIFGPLGMTDTGFRLSPWMRDRCVGMHKRARDGFIALIEGFALPEEPEVEMGGQGLYSTMPEMLALLRMWLNDGAGPEGRVLRAETIEQAARDGLAGLRLHTLPSVIPQIARTYALDPDDIGWGLSFAINRTMLPTGRQVGSLAWAGLANLYYWIDRSSGLAGFWATQLFPFADPAAITAAEAFETVAYRALTVNSKSQTL